VSDSFVLRHLAGTAHIAEAIDVDAVEQLVTTLLRVRTRGGRLFLLGIGRGAGHSSHAPNDFRKLAGFEAYAPTDNVSELTACANDGGWDDVFSGWLEESRLGSKDGGCHIITLTTDLLHKLPLAGKDLEFFSVETVRMFHGDACSAGYVLKGYESLA
jgi:phosphoheptose isomerase